MQAAAAPAASFSQTPVTVEGQQVAPAGQTQELAEDVAMGNDELLAIPSETVYVNNLNENVRIAVLKQTLRNLFRNFGPVLDVVAHQSMRMRGQAFVAMATPEAAARAVKEAQRFPLYGKALNLNFAKTRADAVVKRKAPTEMDSHLEERKERKKATRRHNPVTDKLHKQRKARKGAAQGVAAGASATAVGQSKASRQGAADDYLPPNKILFLQNLPESTTRQVLEQLFKQYPGFQEVRTVPAKRSIAFVEYEDETTSSAARDALFNAELEGTKIKITFAKKA